MKKTLTDEQLINIMDAFILKNTEFMPDEFTGGSVQTTYTEAGGIKYAVHFFFGYDKNRNSISITKKIKGESRNNWLQSIDAKVAILYQRTFFNEMDEIHELMNYDTEQHDTKESDIKKIGSGYSGKGIEVCGSGSGTLRTDNRTKASDALVVDVIDYLNKITGKSFSSKAKLAIQHITAREKEGRTLEQFKTVIDNKYRGWNKDKKMAKYLVPETLFGNKFDGYLNETVAKSSLDVKNTSYEDEKEF